MSENIVTHEELEWNEFVFKKKTYKLLENVGFEKKLDAARLLMENSTIVSDEYGTAHQTTDFDAISELVYVATLTNIKVDFRLPPERLYKLYDELQQQGVLRFIHNKASADIYDISNCYARHFAILQSQVEKVFESRRHRESFGVYAKEIMRSFIGEGDMGHIVAEGTGLIEGLQHVMQEYRAVGATGKAPEVEPRREIQRDNIINLSVRESVGIEDDVTTE